MQAAVTARIVVAFALILACAAVASAADVTGTWDVTINSPEPMKWSMVLEQKDNNVTGKIRLGTTASAGVQDVTGKIDGDQITVSFIVPDSDGDRPFTLSGEVAGDAIKGKKTNLWMYGDGDWTAKKGS